MIRYIRVLGAALGGAIGLVLATTGAGCSMATTPARLLAVWVVAWLVVGFAILPYLTVVPAAWLIRAGRGPLHGGVHRCGRRIAHRAADGLAAGFPLSGLPEPWGTLLPLGVSIFLGLGMLGLTVAKREDLLDRR